MLEMGTAYLPINEGWSHFIEQAEGYYNSKLGEISKLLVKLASEAVSLVNGDKYV